jgi:hypothetical protein
LRDHLDQRRGQERQPNEPSDIAHDQRQLNLPVDDN